MATRRVRIGLDSEPWGDDLVMPDAFGNRLIFHTSRAAEGARENA